MTDEAKALVERLRWGAWYYEDPFDGKAYASDDPLEAADLIETQARENERLRSVVEKYAIDLCEMGGSHELCGLLSEVECGGCFARAALAGDSHE